MRAIPFLDALHSINTNRILPSTTYALIQHKPLCHSFIPVLSSIGNKFGPRKTKHCFCVHLLKLFAICRLSSPENRKRGLGFCGLRQGKAQRQR